MIHPTPESLDLTFPKNYEDVAERLRANHFYPAFLKEIKRKKEVIVGLSIDAIGIMMEDRCARLREVLKDEKIDATVTPMKNLGYISVTLNKKSK